MEPRIRLDIFLTLSLTFFISACGGTSGGGAGSSPPASAAHEWTWMTGANEDTPFDNSDPVYGTQGVASAANTPGGRNSGASWTDHSGNLWLFGGDGLDANVTEGSLNDLWEFIPNTNQWVWVSGSDRADQSGVYGVLGTAATSNVPGGRTNSVAWADGGGNLWLFGGLGYDSNGAYGYLNDLWEFNPSSEEWTWVSGSSTVQGAEVAIYGAMGVAAPGNVPRGFAEATGWADSNGNLWLFGGYAYDGTGSEGYGWYNNLWKFDPGTAEWTWVSGGGPNNDQPGVYGMEGVPSPANVPGSRSGAVSWIDSSGKLWLFGGNSGVGLFNDLWNFNPTSGQWTWISGASGPGAGSAGLPGQYGTMGIASVSNVPGGREDASGWIDSSGNLWLFGGDGYDSTLSSSGGVWLDDLWEFNPSNNAWKWVNGYNIGNQPGVYGVKGMPSANNVPGCRYSASSWIDSDGNFWIFAGWGNDDNYAEAGATILNDMWRYEPN
ncbi:MAG: kelch repeat-containing protein [Candidatus Sulfotelmatobacter sp.]|jgi:N-acetylneuraminic acid mutarotase